ncbi:MAG: integrase arm-type DNA-binding domain-containing protein [Acidimicrobiaceae bacterium]|nr:integrase arm-type DNA-binding domain-containing protein [Acidimicrobiaceae bacterium]
MSKLTAMEVAHAGPGKHSDGNGLTLVVKPSGSRSWVVRYHDGSRRRDRGLGAFPDVTLAEARRRAESVHAGAAGIAPKPAQRLTFAEAARQAHDHYGQQWRGENTARDTWRRLERHAAPLMSMPVADVQRGDVLAVLLPIWHDKPAAAKRLRQDIRRVLGWAAAHDASILSNEAGEVISAALTRQRPKRHRDAVPAADVPELLAIVRDSDSGDAAKLCLEWVALTACRSGEAREMTWAEISGDVWTVPAERTKQGRSHRVPLSRRALDVLAEARKLDDGSGYVFPSPRGGSLHGATLLKLLRENCTGSSVHGLRASFRGWALAQPGVSWAAAELALAHSLGSDTAQAYLRGDADLLDERRDLMQRWADYLDGC